MASGKRELWSVSADGTDRNQVSAMEGLVSEPALSPDGRRIVHCAQTGSNWDIWITPATGGLGVRLNDWPSEEFGPRWSPDGERIAFVSDRRPATGDSTANYHVYTMPAEGGEATWVTGGASVDWSPDGRSLVVVQRWGNGRGLHVVPASGGTPTPLHDDPASGWLRWSPDGSEILLSPLDVHGAIWVADVSALVGR
jgi:tricorn protease